MYPIRKVLILLAIAVFWLAAVAPAADRSVGVVVSADLPRYDEAYKAFVAELARAGYDKSKVDVYLQTPNPDLMSWTNSVRKFVGVGANVIVTFGCGATQTAAKETDDIPVVYAFIYDTQAAGLQKKNVTGVSSKVPMVTLLKTLKSVTPFSKLAVVYNRQESDSASELDEVKKNAAGLGFQVSEADCGSAGELKSKVSRLIGSVDALYISSSAVVGSGASGMIAAASKAGKPVVTLSPDFVDAGALLTLSPSASEQGALAAGITAKILSGAQPSGIGVESARKVDLVLNLKTAKKLDLKVPFDVLNAATKVIK